MRTSLQASEVTTSCRMMCMVVISKSKPEFPVIVVPSAMRPVCTRKQSVSQSVSQQSVSQSASHSLSVSRSDTQSVTTSLLLLIAAQLTHVPVAVKCVLAHLRRWQVTLEGSFRLFWFRTKIESRSISTAIRIMPTERRARWCCCSLIPSVPLRPSSLKVTHHVVRGKWLNGQGWSG